jgi:hypothetical protein
MTPMIREIIVLIFEAIMPVVSFGEDINLVSQIDLMMLPQRIIQITWLLVVLKTISIKNPSYSNRDLRN